MMKKGGTGWKTVEDDGPNDIQHVMEQPGVALSLGPAAHSPSRSRLLPATHDQISHGNNQSTPLSAVTTIG